jgi:hypothetical protein
MKMGKWNSAFLTFSNFHIFTFPHDDESKNNQSFGFVRNSKKD